MTILVFWEIYKKGGIELIDDLIVGSVTKALSTVGKFFLGDFIGDSVAVGFFMVVLIGGLMLTYAMGGKRRVR